MQRLERELDFSADGKKVWSRDWIAFGFEALHRLMEKYGGRYSFGDEVTFADLCLVPQLYNARRFAVDLSVFPRLLQVEERLSALPSFERARPENQLDAV